MPPSTAPAPALDEARLEAFLGSVVGDVGGAATVAMICLGESLGLYEAMTGTGPLTADQLATTADCNPRLVREWLDQQATAGYVEHDTVTDAYELPSEHAMVLAERTSPAFVAGGQWAIASIFKDLERTIDAFRGDGGVPWGDHHPCLFHGTAEFFRPSYEANLTSSWIPALDGVDERLRAGGHVADVGCGHGHSTVLIAAAYPAAEVVGFDPHAGSVEAARDSAAARELTNVRFTATPADGYDGRYDLIVFGDCLHDMGDPVGAARHARSRLTEIGTVMVVEPFALDDRSANHGTLTAKLFYGASTGICTPSALSQPGGMALGAQSGEAGMREVFDTAGFTHFRRAAETPFNIVYEARP